MAGKTYRLEDDLMRKSRPKWNSKRWRRLNDALGSRMFSRCERCGRMLFNPQSILLHQGGFCQATIKKEGLLKEIIMASTFPVPMAPNGLTKLMIMEPTSPAPVAPSPKKDIMYAVQLMLPRYEVVADMPFRPAEYMFQVGDIITVKSQNRVVNQGGVYVMPIDFDKWPFIFRRMAWYEKLKREEFPDFLKTEKPNRIISIKNWWRENESNYITRDMGDGKITVWHLSQTKPSWEAEYDEFITQQGK